MDKNYYIKKALPSISEDLIGEINKTALLKEIPRNTQILREGQYINVIPIVVEGLIKIIVRFEEKDLLLYYIKPGESCIMSFTAGLKDEPSRVIAIAEEDTTALLLPVNEVIKWTKQFTDFNTIFFHQYNLRYSELLNTIQHVLFNKMDSRLYNFIKERVELTNKNPLQISHRQIANELGTAREVISRTIKKLEAEEKVKQHSNSIELL